MSMLVSDDVGVCVFGGLKIEVADGLSAEGRKWEMVGYLCIMYSLYELCFYL